MRARPSRRGHLLAACGVALGLLIQAASPVLAAEQEPTVAVFVDRPRPSASDTVHLTYTFSGSGTGGKIGMPSSLPLKNLTVVAGPSSSTKITFINGDIQRSTSLTYYLRPSGPGNAEVGETTWIVGDKTIKAAASVLEVGAARQPGPGIAEDEQQQQPDDPFDAFFRPRRRAPNPQTTAARREAIIEFVATPDRTTAYVGEEVAIHYELVTQADIEGLEFVEPPKYPGLWAEDLEKPEKPVGRRDVYDNRPVTRFTLLKKSVSGLAPGTISLPAAKVRLAVRTAGDPFADPFSFMQRQVVERATKPINLKILAIPGRKDFKGPVGRFDVTARLDRTRVSAGDAVTLKVRIAGNGNLRTATEAPQISIPNSRLYPPTRIGDPAGKAGRQGAFAEWDYVLVPNAAGALTIPAISMEVFDPSEKRIVAKSSSPITLIVDRAVEAALPAPATATASGVPATEGSALTTSPAPASTSGAAVTEAAPDPKATPAPAAGPVKAGPATPK
ncbi:MAG: BatD family protein, partial [Thermoanaerobaculia bacterium]